MDPQLTSQIVPIEEVRVIEESLAALAENTGGNHILLLDKSGQVIAAYGDSSRQDMTALSLHHVRLPSYYAKKISASYLPRVCVRISFLR